MKRERLSINPNPELWGSLKKYAIRDVDPNGCWGWAASFRTGGYGQVCVDGRSYAAHRVSYAVHYGVDPGELEVCHACDNPPCTNPKHLFLGTQAENLADGRNKGRIKGSRRSRNAGTYNGQAKLSDAQVDEIRAAVRGGMTQRRAAAIYGVSNQHISRIVRGKKWAKPTPELSSPF